MKNTLIFVTVIIFFAIIFFISDIEGFENLDNSISIKNVKNISEKEFKNIKSNRQESVYDLVNMKYKNNELPHDSKKDAYYIPNYNKEYNFNLFYNKSTTIKSISNNEKNLIKIIAYNKNKYKVYNISLTNMPIINIELEDKNNKNELISDDYTYGKINIFDNKTKQNKINILNESAKLKIRGLSSSQYDKKSYSIQFINSNSGKEKFINDLLGMDRNSKFILNSLYEDSSKIRDKLSWDTWKHISQNKDNTIKMEYVELFINDQYYGIYGLSEMPNEYKLKAQQDSSIIYKIKNDKILPELKDLSLDDLKKYGERSVNIIYPKSFSNDTLQPLKELSKLIYHTTNEQFEASIIDYISIDNCVDYFILLECAYHIDGLGNNNIFTYDIKSKKFTRTPWDLDLTWGAYPVWVKDGDVMKELLPDEKIELSKQLLYKNGNMTKTTTYLEQRLWQNNVGNFRQKVAKRWKELRSGFLETESFVNYANSLYDEVTESGAREREHERWPDGGYSTDNSFIEKFIRQRLPYLDSQFLQYLDDSGEN
ncbi:CotH kinase family protein [Intestinibacter bartlettii]|uniref:CotH kinase family protein n=1 Tax=Intestinibacter bartlettii TaxID=261299 RepID=UPI0022E755AF|nr:CotH kinase family protein [Intestinibacter bartlettii]